MKKKFAQKIEKYVILNRSKGFLLTAEKKELLKIIEITTLSKSA